MRSLGIYTFTNFFGKGVAFLLLPYFTEVLSKSDMGLINLFSSSMIFLIPFISMGVLQSVNTEFFKLDKKQFRDLFSTSLILPTTVFLLSLLGFYLFRNVLIEQYKFPPLFIWLIPVVTFLSFIGQHLMNLIRNEERPNLFMGVTLGRLFTEIGLAVGLISLAGWAWQGRVSGIAISYILLGLYALWYFNRKQYLFGQIKKDILKDELLFSVPIILMQFSTFCMNYSDSFFLSRFTSDNNAEVGVYSIACIFASIIITLSSALLQYVHPKIFRLLSEPQINYAAIRKFFLLYIGVMTGGLVVLLVFVPLAYHWVINVNYRAGMDYYYLLCIGYYLWTIAYLFFSFLLYYKQKRTIIWLSVSFIIVSLTSNYFFISNMTSRGGAISVCLSYIIVLILTLWVTRKQMGFLFAPGSVKKNDKDTKA